ncbi:MAG: alpha/beta fold hydrolase [Paracoccaceae bacterium]
MRESTIWQRLTRRFEARCPPLGGFVPVEGGRVHFLADGPREGDTPPIVLIHGASGNLRDFALALMPLLARKRHVIAVDRPGFGHSSHAVGAVRLTGQVRVLRTALRRLGHRRAVLVGHSYGAAVAMAWALEHADDVAALGLVSGATMDWGGGLGALYRLGGTRGLGFLVSQLAPFTREAVIERTLASIFTPDPVPARYRAEGGVELALRPATFRLNARQVNALHAQVVAREADYPRISCPVAIVHGERDGVVPAEVHAKPLAARVPHARLTLLPEAGHMPHHAQAEAVADAILAALPARPATGEPRRSGAPSRP